MNKRIALLGEILVDLVVSEDLSIKPCPGGSIFNSANTLAKLRARTSFYSQLGNDYWGKYLLDFMNNEGIDNSGISKSNINKTPLAFAIIDKNGNANYDFYKSNFTEKIISDFSDVGIFHFGSFFSLLPENSGIMKNFFDNSKKTGCLVSYDPNFRAGFEKYKNSLFSNFKKADIIKASLEDINNIFNTVKLDDAFDILEKFNPVLTIITLGNEGSAAKLAGKSYIKLEGNDVMIVDTIGAGDNFSAGFLFYLYINDIFDKEKLSKIDDDSIYKMLTFANNVAVESLKVKGAGIDKEKLSALKKTLN